MRAGESEVRGEQGCERERGENGKERRKGMRERTKWKGRLDMEGGVMGRKSESK